MNKAQLTGMRAMADALHVHVPKKWKIVSVEGRVLMFHLDKVRADEMHDKWHPDCLVVEM